MTAEQIAAMTDLELNREIAQMHGWRLREFDSGIPSHGSPILQTIPDYCRDLNAAMALRPEYEDRAAYILYRGNLGLILGCSWGDTLRFFDRLPHRLKPRKLAEAFLLWKAGEP